MKYLLSFIAGVIVCALLGFGLGTARAMPAPEETTTPTMLPTATRAATRTAAPTATRAATITPTVTATLQSGAMVAQEIRVAKNIVLGLTGAVECWNCAPFSPSWGGKVVKVKLSNYLPWAGGINCWEWDKDLEYCMSETSSGNDWEPYYGLSAACPQEWKHGTWVAIDGVGAFICLDWGSAIVCHDGDEAELAAGTEPHCHVDILGPSGSWNQKLFEATLWVSLNPRR